MLCISYVAVKNGLLEFCLRNRKKSTSLFLLKTFNLSVRISVPIRLFLPIISVPIIRTYVFCRIFLVTKEAFARRYANFH